MTPTETQVLKQLIVHPKLETVPYSQISAVALLTMEVYNQVLKDEADQQHKEKGGNIW